ncbi:MAG TPA: hypothetical protein VG826_24880 [Pirellulales bacterium]|nr:hypothetical protein [Pirellulales bacterium]
MNRSSFVRKLVYIVIIALLLVPLSIYSQPSVVGANNEVSEGGKLAQLRKEYQISESSLGEIDPTGETIKLATLGLRGVAANLLWHKAEQAKMKEDWDGLQATLDQITKLEPHFITVWRYQAWNVSYNISVEWDDYHDRYFWVKEGIKFLLRGFRYNDHEPRVLYDVGWTTGQKMGTADEKVQYRRLFREDDDEEFPDHRLRPQNRRDNWLVGQEYFEKAIHLVEDRGASIRRQNPLVFFSEPAMCQIDYAIALAEDGIFEEKGKVAWTDADGYWTRFGQRSIPTTFGIEIRLSEYEPLMEQVTAVAKKLDDIEPDLRQKIIEERRAKLTQDERDAMDVPQQKRTPEQMRVAFEAQIRLNVSMKELADRVGQARREEAQKLVEDAVKLQERANIIGRERDVVNFKYWRMRCQLEKTDPALNARRLIYEADELYKLTQLPEARRTYEEAFANWRKVVDQFPEMADDAIGGTSIEDAIRGYFDVLKQLDEPSFPKDFALMDVARNMMIRNAIPIPPEFMETIGQQPAGQPAVDENGEGEKGAGANAEGETQPVPEEKTDEEKAGDASTESDKPAEAPAKESDPPADAK